MRSEATLRRIVKTWQKRLKLEHIALDISIEDGPDNPDALASVSPDSLYDMAELRFRGDWASHDLFMLNRLVVHELLHIMFRDYTNAIRSVGEAGILSHQTQVLWYDRCNDAEEAVIDRLAHRLVEVGGAVT